MVWEPGQDRGTAVFRDSFDLSTKEAQDFILGTCQALRDRTCSQPGCTEGKLTLPGEVECWPEEFLTWYTVRAVAACAYILHVAALSLVCCCAQNKAGGTSLPTGPSFNAELQQFRAAHPQYAGKIGFIGGALRFIVINAVSSLEAFLPHFITRPVFDVRHVRRCAAVTTLPHHRVPVSSLAGIWRVCCRAQCGCASFCWPRVPR